MALVIHKISQMKQIIDFLKSMFSGGSEISSKRVNGTIAYMACTISICCVNPQYLPLLLGSATLLLGASLIEKK